MFRLSFAVPAFAASAVGLLTLISHAQDDPKPAPLAPAARIDGTGPGWKPLGKGDFVNVNCDENTWSFPDGEIHCTGSPVGVISQSRLLSIVVRVAVIENLNFNSRRQSVAFQRG